MAGIAIRRVVRAEPEQRMLNSMNARQHVVLRASQRGQAELAESLLQFANVVLAKRDVVQQVASAGREFRVDLLQLRFEARGQGGRFASGHRPVSYIRSGRAGGFRALAKTRFPAASPGSRPRRMAAGCPYRGISASTPRISPPAASAWRRRCSGTTPRHLSGCRAGGSQNTSAFPPSKPLRRCHEWISAGRVHARKTAGRHWR